MEFFSPSELKASGKDLFRKGRSFGSAKALLQNESEDFREVEKYDIFLSHSRLDAELVHGLTRVLESNGFTVYVYWVEDDTQQGRVTPETATRLRKRMNSCKSLLYGTSNNADNSRWMPWELGYFDGTRGKVAVCPIQYSSQFEGQEYLGLYPVMERDFWLWKDGRAYKKLREWINE
jgi:hypothetical protein